MVSTPSKTISQIGSFPQVGVKIKNISNHLLVHVGKYTVRPHASVMGDWKWDPVILPLSPGGYSRGHALPLHSMLLVGHWKWKQWQ